MPPIVRPPVHLTILRKDDTNIIDLAEVGSLIPRSETQVDGAFLQELAAEVMHLTAPGYGRLDSLNGPGSHSGSAAHKGVVRDLERIGELIFSHLLTEPARKKLRTTAPCDLYLRLDEQLIHIPWELAYDGNEFLATKFRLGRQVITGYTIPDREVTHEITTHLKVLLIADPTESLPQASAEVEQLCALLDTIPDVEVTLIGGNGVRKVPLLAALQTHDIVHFAGHSAYDPDHPNKSGWCLSEGVLTAGELSKLSRPPLLVFSNSCQAGATAEWAGGYRYEGQAFGIGSAFLLAGVRNYVGTFWVVHDEESVLFAAAFYRSLATGLSLGESLLTARQEIVAQRGRQSLTWASYMLYGDPALVLLPEGKERPLPDVPVEPKIPQIISPPVVPDGQVQVESHPSKESWWQSRPPVHRVALIVGITVGVLLLSSPFFWPELSFAPRSHPHPSAPQHLSSSVSVPQEKPQLKAIGVMHFKPLSRDPQLEWMPDAIRDSFNSQLSNASDVKVYSKEYIDFLVRKGLVTEIEVASQLGIAKMISGSFLAVGGKLRIEAHIVDVQSGVLETSVHVEGAQGDFFPLHKQLALQIMARLGLPLAPEQPESTTAAPSAPSLDMYKLLLEAEGETPAPGPTEGEKPDAQSFLPQQQDRLSRFAFLWTWVEPSAAWAQESLPQGYVAEEEIRQVLERYRQAYERKDLVLLGSVYDTLTPAQQAANAKYFRNVEDLRVTIRDVDIAVSGDEAAVSYTREDQFVDAKSGRNAKLAVRFTKFLVRLDNNWKIASGKKELLAPVKE